MRVKDLSNFLVYLGFEPYVAHTWKLNDVINVYAYISVINDVKCLTFSKDFDNFNSEHKYFFDDNHDLERHEKTKIEIMEKLYTWIS